MEQNRGRIAKNSFMLFARMGIILLSTLYISRIILQELGVTNYGIYNVVGGVVGLMTFINGTLTQGVQRYINYYKARKENLLISKIFSASLIIICGLTIVMLLLGETIGVWFVNTYLNIPENKMYATNWVFQFSLLACIFGLFQIPYKALIIAYEDMHIYTYLSFSEAGLKLGAALILGVFSNYKLIIYAVLLAGVTLLTTFFYFCISKHRYEVCKFSYPKNKGLYTELLSFSGWTIIGTGANVMSVQGLSVVLNVFFGTIVNAARGIATQVGAAVDTMTNNIQVAMNPQLIQLYSTGNLVEMRKLLTDNFKWNFFMMWIGGFPIIFNTYRILDYWLGEVPEYTVIFTQLVIVRCLLKVFERPMVTCEMAHGKMKYPNIIPGSILILEIILACLLFKIGYNPVWAYIIDILGITACIIFHILYLREKGIIIIKEVITELGKHIMPLITVCCSLGWILERYFKDETFLMFISKIIIEVIICVGCVWIFGIKKTERRSLLKKIQNKIDSNKAKI